MPFTRIFCLLLFSLTCFQGLAVEIFVSVNGSDKNNGSRSGPLATVAMALRMARELRRLKDPSITDGIYIRVAGGFYFLQEPIIIRPEDAGTAKSPTLITGDDQTILSGGRQILNWKKAGVTPGLPKAVAGKVWVAELSTRNSPSFRQLWVNGRKAVRAKHTRGQSMSRILSWDHEGESCWIPKPENFTFQEGMEMFIHQWWAIAVLRIKSAKIISDSVKLQFEQPESRIQSEHPWPAPWISKETGNSAFYLSNALQFLDEPGEWYLDEQAQKLYYYPMRGEDMRTASVIAPVLETLVRMAGTADHPVEHIHFKSISFQHSNWLRPSLQGHVPHQAGMFMLDAYKLKIPGTPDKSALENQAWVGRPAAAVEWFHVKESSFERCRFEHLSSTGLDINKGSRNNQVHGNLFKDIGGTAILAGVFSDEQVEVHLPYDPSDEKEVVDDIQISNNLITDAANEDWGCVGIGAGYVKNIRIQHNELSELSYTGISLGWGWTPTVNAMRNNRILANHIHHYGRHMYDVAGIYTLSAQPQTIISANYIDSIYKAPYAHIPSHWFYLYTDEGSSYITVQNNWCPSEKFLQNANGPANHWANNGPQVSDSIKMEAGLQAAYHYLIRDRVTRNDAPINHHNPVKK